MEEQGEIQEQNQEVEEEKEEDVQTSSEEKGSNKATLVIVGFLGVIIIAMGAFFLTKSQSDKGGVSDVSVEEVVEEDVKHEESMLEENEVIETATESADENVATQEGEVEIGNESRE
ncbi:hypothetical protein JXA63_00215 [Candidatus Woesebacteria bacterium]|nr:hypothetical protein [Candidatus Woesebacteria bacterium]